MCQAASERLYGPWLGLRVVGQADERAVVAHRGLLLDGQVSVHLQSRLQHAARPLLMQRVFDFKLQRELYGVLTFKGEKTKKYCLFARIQSHHVQLFKMTQHPVLYTAVVAIHP